MKTAMKKQTITRTLTITNAVVKFVDMSAEKFVMFAESNKLISPVE